MQKNVNQGINSFHVLPEVKQIGVIYETNYSRMDQVKFVEDSLYKKLKENGLLKQTVLLQTFYRLSSTNFTWSILEYFD